jgi:hypothetical protein
VSRGWRTVWCFLVTATTRRRTVLLRVIVLDDSEGVHGETVTISSNISNYPVLLAKIYSTTTASVGGFSTDATGRSSIKVNITTAPIGSQATLAVTIGTAACSATFTPVQDDSPRAP